MTITDFILARLDSEESLARLAAADHREALRRQAAAYDVEEQDDDPPRPPKLTTTTVGEAGEDAMDWFKSPAEPDPTEVVPTPAMVMFDLKHNPTRVLAQCAALREVVERCGGVGFGMPSHHLADGVLRALATTWVDHDDYRQEWA